MAETVVAVSPADGAPLGEPEPAQHGACPGGRR